MKIEKNIPMEDNKRHYKELDKLTSEMEIGDSILFNNKKDAERAMRYINRHFGERAMTYNRSGAAQSKTQKDGSVRVWRKAIQWHPYRDGEDHD